MECVEALDEEIELAKGEPSVTGKALLEEILPLMEDYFVGEISLKGNGLVYRMPNGQRFVITATAE